MQSVLEYHAAMNHQNPYRRASPSLDSFPTSRNAQEKEVLSARGHGYNEDHSRNSSRRDTRGSRDWTTPKDDDQYLSDGTKRQTRSIDKDWFEERLAQKARPDSPKARSRKAGWNLWISPDLQSTTQNSGTRKSSDPDAGKRLQLSGV